MKRFFSYIGASLVAIAALSSCNKEIENPSSEASNGIQFAITASSVDTKTSIDGFKTSWVADDELDITHAIAGSTTYITDGSFSISKDDLATNKFNGTLKSNLEEGSSYDWYALYPYNNGKNYTYIGHSKGATQNGNNSTAHLCGTLCPLYGVAKNVNSSDPVSFDMQHLAAVVEITVTNETDTDLTVKNITFASSDENIVGSYIINFKGDNVTYAASGEQYVSKVATLNVTNGDAIAKNGSAKFYIPIKPHIAEAGSKIVINVNGYEKEITLTKDVTFKAGTVKKIGFKCDRVSTSATFDFTDPTSLGLPAKAGDITKPIVSENISLTTTSGTYTNTKIYNTNNKFELRAYTGSTLSFKAPDSYIIKSIVFSGKAINACSVDVGEFSSGTWTGANQSVKFSATNTLKISKIIVSYVKGEPTTSIIADNIANISARGVTDGELTYTIENPIEGTTLEASCDESVVDVVHVESGKVLYSVSKNTANTIRTGRITLTYGNVSKDITISQNAAQFKVSRNEVELEATSNASTNVTITSDFDWIANKDKTGDGFDFTPNTYTWAEDGKETLTITALSDNASSEGTKILGAISVQNTETGETIEITVKQKSSYVTTQNSLKYTYSSNEGWTINGTDKKTYHALLGSTKYILSPEFTFTKITSITIKARTFGGTGNNNTIKITYGDKVLGTILPTDSTPRTYSLTNLATLSGKGSIKFAAPSSSSSKGPGIFEITIAYE